ncbi:MAG: hypothetical protein MO846_09800 [Candidatus Devosia symbiotica]|nr:hypothetical protein [Candidatus Devosia symbiotica]
MDEPKQKPFALNNSRVIMLILGALLVLIAISTAMGGLGFYQQLKEAAAAATTETTETLAQ